MSDPYDDADYDEDCYGCGRSPCECPDDDHDYDDLHCSECAVWGAIQCRVHADAEIEAMRAQHEHYAVREALETLLACPEAWHGPQWQCVLLLGREVLTAMEATGE